MDECFLTEVYKYERMEMHGIQEKPICGGTKERGRERDHKKFLGRVLLVFNL